MNKSKTNNSAFNLKCPICVNDSKLYIKTNEVLVFKCNICKHIFSDLGNNNIYNDDYFNVTHQNWFNNPNIKLFSIIEKNIIKSHNKNSSIIDVGCGNGDLLKYLLQKGYTNLTGSDIINNYFDTIKYIKADYKELSEDQKYDIIISTGTIEHVDNPIIFKNKLFSIAQNNSLIIIMTINEKSIIYTLSKMFYWLGLTFGVNRLYEKHHINHFNIDTLTKLFTEQNTNHRIQHIKTIQHNFPANSIDLPKGINCPLFKFVIFLLFKLSSLLKTEILQTQVFVAQKKD